MGWSWGQWIFKSLTPLVKGCTARCPLDGRISESIKLFVPFFLEIVSQKMYLVGEFWFFFISTIRQIDRKIIKVDSAPQFWQVFVKTAHLIEYFSKNSVLTQDTVNPLIVIVIEGILTSIRQLSQAQCCLEQFGGLWAN